MKRIVSRVIGTRALHYTDGVLDTSRRNATTKKVVTKKKRVAKCRTKKTATRQVAEVVTRQVVTEATATGDMTGAELRSAMDAHFGSQYDDVVAAAQRKPSNLKKKIWLCMRNRLALNSKQGLR